MALESRNLQGFHAQSQIAWNAQSRRLWKKAPAVAFIVAADTISAQRRNLPEAQLSLTLKAMEVHFTPEQQAKLAQIATQAGTVPERLVTNVVARYLDEEARFLAAVEKGIAAAERGEFIEEEEMDARLEAMFKA